MDRRLSRIHLDLISSQSISLQTYRHLTRLLVSRSNTAILQSTNPYLAPLS